MRNFLLSAIHVTFVDRGGAFARPQFADYASVHVFPCYHSGSFSASNSGRVAMSRFICLLNHSCYAYLIYCPIARACVVVCTARVHGLLK